jgi:hypothetical protein
MLARSVATARIFSVVTKRNLLFSVGYRNFHDHRDRDNGREIPLVLEIARIFCRSEPDAPFIIFAAYIFVHPFFSARTDETVSYKKLESDFVENQPLSASRQLARKRSNIPRDRKVSAPAANAQ